MLGVEAVWCARVFFEQLGDGFDLCGTGGGGDREGGVAVVQLVLRVGHRPLVLPFVRV